MSFWLSACTVLIVVRFFFFFIYLLFFFLKENVFLAFCLYCFDSGALLYLRPSFLLVSWTEGAK